MQNSMKLDLGMGYTAEWLGWHPDRSIPANFKQYHDVQDIERSLLLITCPHGTNGGVHPDTPEVRRVFTTGPFWQVISWEPLHLEPSILMKTCGCHGFIRNGKWVPA